MTTSVWAAFVANGSAGDRAESRPASTSHTARSSAAMTAASGPAAWTSAEWVCSEEGGAGTTCHSPTSGGAAVDELGARQVGGADGEGERHQARLDADAELGAEPSAVGVGLDDDAVAGRVGPRRGEAEHEARGARRTSH